MGKGQAEDPAGEAMDLPAGLCNRPDHLLPEGSRGDTGASPSNQDQAAPMLAALRRAQAEGLSGPGAGRPRPTAHPGRAARARGGAQAAWRTRRGELQIRLLVVLPPRSPKLNGAVERANRTHAEELYDFSVAPPTVAELGRKLREWERIYNTVRSDQALGHLTPKQLLDQWHQLDPREVLSRR